VNPKLSDCWDAQNKKCEKFFTLPTFDPNGDFKRICPSDETDKSSGSMQAGKGNFLIAQILRILSKVPNCDIREL